MVQQGLLVVMEQEALSLIHQQLLQMEQQDQVLDLLGITY
jgi:hypothetical protein